MRALLVLVLISICNISRSQDVQSVHPIQTNCYNLSPNRPIKPFRDTNYSGKIVIEAVIDTSCIEFSEFKIAFAKLKSNKDPQDSIVLRPKSKFGKIGYLEEILPQLIRHLNYIKLDKTENRNCINSESYFLPIRLE